MARKKQKAVGAFRVEGEMTIYRANELAQGLFASMREQAGDLSLDLSQVTEFDTAGLQILLMARRIADADGRRIDFVHASACVIDVLQLCNVAATAPEIENVSERAAS